MRRITLVMSSDNKLHKAVVLADVPLEDILTRTQDTLETGTV